MTSACLFPPRLPLFDDDFAQAYQCRQGSRAESREMIFIDFGAMLDMSRRAPENDTFTRRSTENYGHDATRRERRLHHRISPHRRNCRCCSPKNTWKSVGAAFLIFRRLLFSPAGMLHLLKAGPRGRLPVSRRRARSSIDERLLIKTTRKIFAEAGRRRSWPAPRAFGQAVGAGYNISS